LRAKRQSRAAGALSALGMILLLAGIAFGLLNFRIYTVLSDSMAPAVAPDDRIVAETGPLRDGDVRRGDIVMLRTAELTTMADFFVVCSGRSDRQVQALSGAIVDELRADGVRPLGMEGQDAGRWVLIDYGAVIVHVFAPEEREFYGLERLWSGAPQVVRVV
jgi:ribosome-associated protein